MTIKKLILNKNLIEEYINKFDLEYIEFSTNKDQINKTFKNVKNIEIEFNEDNIEELNDMEFIDLLNIFMLLDNYFKGSINNNEDIIELIEVNMIKRFNDKFNNLIEIFLNSYDIYLNHNFYYDWANNLINQYLYEMKSLNYFIDLNYNDNYYNCLYDEIIDYCYIMDYDDTIEDINEIMEINDNLKPYIDYEELIYNLVNYDEYYYEIKYNNKFYYIHNSYF